MQRQGKDCEMCCLPWRSMASFVMASIMLLMSPLIAAVSIRLIAFSFAVSRLLFPSKLCSACKLRALWKAFILTTLRWSEVKRGSGLLCAAIFQCTAKHRVALNLVSSLILLSISDTLRLLLRGGCYRSSAIGFERVQAEYSSQDIVKSKKRQSSPPSLRVASCPWRMWWCEDNATWETLRTVPSATTDRTNEQNPKPQTPNPKPKTMTAACS